jgi:Mrp family chromosome partitioning ATPase
VSLLVPALTATHESLKFRASREARPELAPVASLLASRAAADPEDAMTLVAGLESRDGAGELLLEIAWTLHDEYNSRVLAVEADFRHASFVSRFGLDSEKTLAAVQAGSCSLSEAASTILDRFTVLPAAASAGAGSLSPDMARRIRVDLMPRFDVALVGAPPLSAFSDALALYPSITQMVLVIESGRVGSSELERVAARISEAGIRLLGTVLTERKRRLPRWLLRRFNR